MKQSSKRRIAVGWLSALLLAALTACSSAGPDIAPAPTTVPASAPTAAAQSEAAATQADTVVAKLNLNTASADDFLTVPGVGSRMVREFEEYRPYTSIEQFRREIGKYVDDATVAGYEQYVYVPISVNEASLATLQQIPGLEEAEAQALIDGRPYASNEDFLARLAEYVAAADLATAQGYLSAP